MKDKIYQLIAEKRFEELYNLGYDNLMSSGLGFMHLWYINYKTIVK